MPGGSNLVRYERYRKGPRTPRTAHARYYYTRSLVDPPVKKRPTLVTNRPRCQSAPKVMDSHSRSASPREPMRPQHRPPSPPASPGAFDNRAYTHDEDPNHNDSFTSNGPQHNGHSKEPNGETKLPEAVNLELINLTPKNGTKKKDVEVDMNASNPYDEYFVPVNEHRKFMRGEKLYVTADKRGEKGGCKRPLCWTLLVLVVAAVVALIVLAATGILFSSTPTPLEQYNTSISSARAFGGIGGNEHDHGDNEHDHGDNEHGHGNQMTTATAHEHGPELNDEPSIVSDENDMSLYVPRTVEGELTIDNEEFSAVLEDPESPQYREFVATFTDGMKKALFDRNTLENGNNDVIIEVVKLRKGSVVVTYRIHWKPKLNAEPTPDLLTAKSLKTKLDEYLSTNNRMINVYHVYEGNTPTKPVLDICQIDNNQCEYGCEFDENNLEFTCTCPHGQIFDMMNPKKCMPMLENTYPLTPNENTANKEVKVLHADLSPVTTKPVSEEENPPKETMDVIHNNTFDWKESHHVLPETTTQKDTDLNSSHIYSHGNEHSTPVHESADASPEPTAEPEVEPKPTAEPKRQPESNEANSEFEPNAEPEPTAEPKPEVSISPKAETEHTIEHNIEYESKHQSTVETEAEPEPTSEPKAKPEPTVEPNAEPEPTTERKGEPKIIHEYEVGTESIPPSTVEPKVESEPAAEPTPQPEPTAEPQSELETAVGLKYKSETAAEVPIITEPEPAAEPKPSLEPYEEHTFEHEATSELESNSENKPNFEVVMEPNTESDESIKEKPEPETTLNLQHKSGTVEPRLEPITESSKQETPAENTMPDQDVSGLEVIHNIPTKNTEYPLLGTYAPITTSEPLSKETDTPINIHEILNQANRQGSNNELDAKTNKPVILDKVILENQTERDIGAKPAVETEKATLRVSISEPHIINEPSYEPKPEIISIFNEKSEGASIPKFVTEDISEPTTTDHSEWLESNLGKDIKMPNDLENIDSNNHSSSEQRSFKSIDIYAEDATEKPAENEFVRGPMLETNESEIIKKDNVETTTFISGHFESTISENTESMPKTNPVTKMPEFTEKPQVYIDKQESQSLDSNTTSAIVVPTNPVREYSITDQFNSSEAEKHLIDALITKNETKSETTTKKLIVDDSMDITFDTINMLYNRSSHSIKINNEENSDVTDSIITETTTVSDWLSEPVTEMKFEAINNIEKQETTETSNTKLDEMINNGVNKDDFEPDYLNNMSSNNNKMKEDIPLYGITHDYDSEDPRVKRVNEEKDVSKEASTIKMINEAAVTESHLASSPIETTTVTEYIYKTAEKVINESFMNSAPRTNPDIVAFATTTSTEKSDPAPVWEDSETDLTVKKLEIPIIPHLISNDEVIMTTSPSPTVVSAATDASAVTSNSDETQPPQSKVNNIQEASNSDIESQTNLNNLNVTIYEISSHNRNNSFTVTNQHSAEFEDHETEMNPFLPEVENNKSLVKKLQEGHDIEPTTFNDTQNENIEDRSNNNSEIVSALPKVEENKTNFTTATASSAGFNGFMKSNAPKVDADKVMSESSYSENSNENKPVQISTFLLDTDDLDKEQSSEHKTTVAENNLENGAITPPPASSVDLNDDSDYLSVVPIEEERLEERESLKKDYGSELNDISDSPKKSDRRTLDETKFGTVNDNEA